MCLHIEFVESCTFFSFISQSKQTQLVNPRLVEIFKLGVTLLFTCLFAPLPLNPPCPRAPHLKAAHVFQNDFQLLLTCLSSLHSASVGVQFNSSFYAWQASS